MNASHGIFRFFAVAAAGLLLGGCYLLQPASEPIPAQRFESPSASGLVLLLPGFGDGPQNYIDNGFVDAVRAANPAFDVIAVNAHFGYYRNYSLVERLHQDILSPASARYEEIWLVGISMGGFGAAAYGMTHPELVDGLILLAPYMGSPEVVGDVMASGDLGRWVPPDLSTIDDEKERRFYELWQFYQQYVAAPGRSPRLYLGYGDRDHLREPNAFVAGVLAPERSLVLPGGHKWVVWQPLFSELVKRAIGREAMATAGK